MRYFVCSYSLLYICNKNLKSGKAVVEAYSGTFLETYKNGNNKNSLTQNLQQRFYTPIPQLSVQTSNCFCILQIL